MIVMQWCLHCGLSGGSTLVLTCTRDVQCISVNLSKMHQKASKSDLAVLEVAQKDLRPLVFLQAFFSWPYCLLSLWVSPE